MKLIKDAAARCLFILYLIKHLLFPYLTIIKDMLNSLLLQINVVVKDLRRESKKRRTIITLVISREFIRKPRVFFMFHLFKIKTKIQVQLEEYIKHKQESSPFIAEDQEEILTKFIRFICRSNVSEVTPEDIDSYNNKMLREYTPYSSIKIMQTIRAFIRFHKTDSNIIPNKITNTGIDDLQAVGKKVYEVPLSRPKLGRPFNTLLAKKIKSLRDNEHLSFRAIGKALDKDVKNVYRMYKHKV